MAYEFTPLRPNGRLSITVDGMRIESNCGHGLFKAYVQAVENAERRLEPGWEDRLYKAIAASYPGYVRRKKKKGRAPISVATMLSFVKFALKRLKNKKLESTQVAEARAEICRKCPLNRKVAGCSVCRAVLATLVHPPKEITGIHGCEACGCYMPLKVWIPREQLGGPEEFPYWEHCWMHQATPPAQDAGDSLG